MLIILVFVIFQFHCVTSSQKHTAMFGRLCLESNTTGVKKVSEIACGIRCMREPATCKGFIHDSQDNICTLVEDDNPTTCTEQPVSLKSFIRVQPPAIDRVIKDVEDARPYTFSGIARTSRGELAVVQAWGTQAALYTLDLVYIKPLNVTGAIQLWDVDNRANVLFMSDLDGYKIHVLYDNGTYVHNITTNWRPGGIDANDKYLYVADYSGNKLYRIEIDADFNRVGSDMVIMDVTFLLEPVYVQVRNDKIAVSCLNTVILSDLMGSIQWVAGKNSSGAGPGEFNNAMGLQLDNWGRVMILDFYNYRLKFLAANGEHIQDLVTGLNGAFDVILVGNTLYVCQTDELLKFTISYK